MGKLRPFKSRGRRGEAHTTLDKGTIKLYWRYKGRAYSMMRGWRPDNPVHVRFVEQLRLTITNDLATGNFDETLAKYDPRAKTDSSRRFIQSVDTLWQSFKDASRDRVAETTQKHYWGMCDKALASAKSSDLSLDSLKKLKDDLLSHYAPTTVKRVLQMLRAAYNWAENESLVDTTGTNPFSKLQSSVKEPKSNRSRKAFSQNEVDAIIDRFESTRFDYINFVRFLFATGCRPEEAIALTWNKVSWNFILFDTAYSRGILKSTKTGESRTFPVTEKLMEVLAHQESKVPKNAVTPSSLVFPRPDSSRYIDLSDFTRDVWRPILTELVEMGVVDEYLPTYHCRHTFITNQLRAGKDAATVAAWVGNSSSIIMKHYASASKEEKPV